jgi:hypothetical protein
VPFEPLYLNGRITTHGRKGYSKEAAPYLAALTKGLYPGKTFLVLREIRLLI